MAALEEFGPGIWVGSGPTVTAAGGFHYPTRMAVIRLSDGGLFVWSPVALSDELRAAVDGLGDVRCLIAPNSLHHSFLGEWRRAYPAARLYAAPGLRRRRRDLEFDGDLGDAAAAEWAEEIDQVVVRGNLITTEVVFFHRQSGTAIFTDLIQHFSPTWFSGWRALVARLDLMAGTRARGPSKIPQRIRQPQRRALSSPADPCLADQTGADGARPAGRGRRPGVHRSSVSMAPALTAAL